MLEQRFADGNQVAGNNLIELIEREIDAVIRQSIFRKVIRADPLTAIS